ncbi:WbqC family protein [Marinobacter salarius]|jgi:hypothetical protein|uniref:WbqC family protein n=1 Tax=Marinobacter salarius TaxID=1420917 RepID=UPI003BA99B30
MNVAVMQPYLFPYIGYFQLISASDLFLLFDDVAFIKRGYINRNTILLDGQPFRFTVPVPGASQNKMIEELSYSDDVQKVLKSISQSYSKSPYFNEVYPIIESVLCQEDRSIASLCLESYQRIFSYLGYKKRFVKTSALDYCRNQTAEDRIIDLCKKYDATSYINPIGGVDLYSIDHFKNAGLDLRFLKPELVEYSQPTTKFVPGLSIIDVLMNCSQTEVNSLLSQYELV